MKIINQPLKVVEYHEHSIGSSSGVSAVCYVELKVGECSASFGVAKDSNIMTAAVKASVCGLIEKWLEVIGRAKVWLCHFMRWAHGIHAIFQTNPFVQPTFCCS